MRAERNLASISLAGQINDRNRFVQRVRDVRKAIVTVAGDCCWSMPHINPSQMLSKLRSDPDLSDPSKSHQKLAMLRNFDLVWVSGRFIGCPQRILDPADGAVLF